MNTEKFLKDYAGERQPVLLLMSQKGDELKWRLNFAQREIADPPISVEDGQLASCSWECCFVPNTGGVVSEYGHPPAWDKFAVQLEAKGVSSIDLEQIKVDYDEFVNSNKEAFI